jgi:putative transposase
VRDAELSDRIVELHKKNRSVYGVHKLWRAAVRDDIDVGRDHIARLMNSLGLEGVRRGKRKRTTIVDEQAPRPADLVDRHFQATESNRLWVADNTYVSTWSGFCYVAFVTDVFSRMIVGWQVSTTLRAELALDALEQAIWRRGREVSGLGKDGRPVSEAPHCINGQARLKSYLMKP